MKTWIFTPAFCKAKMLEEQLEHIYKTPPKDVTHVIILQHYPIDKEKNNQAIRDLAQKFGCTLVDSGLDLGLHRGVNNAMKVVSLQPGDFAMGCDPDDRPQEGWVDALREVMSAEPMLAVLALNFGVIDWRRREGVAFKEIEIAGHRVSIHPSVEMFNIIAFNTAFILSIGGFHQPFNYYGCIESSLYGNWLQRGMKFGYLRDYSSEAGLCSRTDLYLDPELRMYKDAHLGGFSDSFEQWLLKFHPGRLQGH